MYKKGKRTWEEVGGRFIKGSFQGMSESIVNVEGSGMKNSAAQFRR